MAFDEGALLTRLHGLPLPRRYCIAFSGGLDSSVLLHAMARLRPQLGIPVCALHADHGLHRDSAAWAAWCVRRADELGLSCVSQRLQLDRGTGKGTEADARSARYAFLRDHMDAGDMLLTAHHRDDQAETLLLQLLRGAGVHGLAGMGVCKPWSLGYLARPLLAFGRDELLAYAQAQGLRWLDDPSNASEDFDRNYLRHRVMPQLRQRWPSAAQTLARSAGHCADAAGLLDVFADQDLMTTPPVPGRLPLTLLRDQSAPRRANLLRRWLRRAGAEPPHTRQLAQVLDGIDNTRNDAQPCLSWGAWAIHRFRDQYWLLPHQLPAPPMAGSGIAWRGQQIDLPHGLGRLTWQNAANGLDPQILHTTRVEIRWRVAGIGCRPPGRDGTRSYKKLCQSFAIPPWIRERMPLIYLDGRLAAFADYCLCEPFRPALGGTGRLPVWTPPSSLPR